MKRMFTLLATAAMAATSAWAGYFSPAFVSTDVDASASVSNETVDKMFDGIYNTKESKWCAATTRGTWKGRYVIMDAGMPIILRGYRLIAGGDTNTNQGRRWKAWKIYGSNSSAADGEWTLVDQKTDSPTSSANYGISDYTTTATVAYRYYKLIVDENVDGDVIQMSEVQLAGTALIATPDDLVNLAKAVNSGSTAINAKLTANIDMTETAWNTPIGIDNARYVGTFDGDGYVIKNLHGSYTADRHGLVGFGNGGMVIKNLIVDGATIHGLHQAAVICGRMNTGASTISNCAVIGEVKVTQQDAAAPSVAVIANACGSDGAALSIVGCYTTSTLPIASSWSKVGYTTTRCYNDVNNNAGLATGELCNDLNGGTVGPWLQTIGEDAYPVLRAGNVVGGVDMTWTPQSQKTGYCTYNQNNTISYNGLNNSKWTGTIMNASNYATPAGGGDIGNTQSYNTSSANTKQIALTYYKSSVDIPSYSKLARTATFNLYFASNAHYHGAGLYLFDTEELAKSTKVDATQNQDQTKADNCIIKATNHDNSGTHISFGPGACTMTFENDGETDAQVSKYLTLMHVVGNSSSSVLKGSSWATFKVPSYVDTWSYGNVITFDANEGTGEMSNQTIWAAGTLTANTITREGYTFAGWNTSADGKGTAYTDEQEITVTAETKGAITLYAQWTANTNTAYVVKHLLEGLDGQYAEKSDDTQNLTGTTGAEVTPDVKSYTGFTAPKSQKVTIAADGSLVVEYKYSRNSYTLTWDAAEGTLTGEYTSGSVKYGAAITAPADPTREGYTFDGWSADVPETMPTGDVTLNAQWKEAVPTAINVNGNEKASKAIKTVENGKIVIIKEGVKYDLVGRKL